MVEQLKIYKMFTHVFPLYHSVIRIEEGIKAISEKTFQHFIIDGKDNLFVTKTEGKIYLIKVTGNQQHFADTTSKHQSVMKSFNQSMNLN